MIYVANIAPSIKWIQHYHLDVYFTMYIYLSSKLCQQHLYSFGVKYKLYKLEFEDMTRTVRNNMLYTCMIKWVFNCHFEFLYLLTMTPEYCINKQWERSVTQSIAVKLLSSDYTRCAECNFRWSHKHSPTYKHEQANRSHNGQLECKGTVEIALVQHGIV